MGTVELDEEACRFYRSSLAVLEEAGTPFLVGGAFALERYTGVSRYTKDFDLFVRPRDARRALEAMGRAGYDTEMTSELWLGKAFYRNLFVDIIFRSGNGVSEVDDTWFEHAVDGEVLGVPTKLCPPEEIIWMKAFIMDRERYDGGDIAHLLRACVRDLDWQRMLSNFGAYWRVLLSHLLLFGFIYPSEAALVPREIMSELLDRLRVETDNPPDPVSTNNPERVCRGTLLSRKQFLIDVEQWGYKDGRLMPAGTMTGDEVAELNEEARE
jgi:Nucleotidyl transferase of unknown function (DUF2204)